MRDWIVVLLFGALCFMTAMYLFRNQGIIILRNESGDIVGILPATQPIQQLQPQPEEVTATEEVTEEEAVPMEEWEKYFIY